MKKTKKKKAAKPPSDDAWRELVKGVNACPMYDLHGLAAEAGIDIRYAVALLQTFCHASQSLH